MRRPTAIGVGAGLLALAACVIVLRPLASATIDTDSATSVLYFRYLVSGHRLEAFVPTVPKPLLTLLFGSTWYLLHDWRALVWETIGSFVMAVSFAGVLAWRVAGSVAAAFVVVALIAWPDMLVEVAHANALPWALAGWFAAGLALTASRPRPVVAGVALLLAGLARLETVWLLAVGVLAILALSVEARQLGHWRGVRTAALTVGIGALTLPLMLLHDWLLTGNPLYWAAVQAGYTATVYPGLRPIGFRQFFLLVWDRYSAQAPTLFLAVVGLVKLAAVRRWWVLGAVALLPVGVTATLGLLAHSGTFYTDRYWQEADVAILFGAAIGSAALARALARPLRAGVSGLRRRPALRRAAKVAAGGLVALGLAGPALSTTDLPQALQHTRSASAHVTSVSAQLAAILQGATGKVVPAPGVELPVVETSSVRLFVPRPDVPRVAVETGAPYAAIGDSFLAFRHQAIQDILRPGQWVFHDVAADTYLDLSALELSAPAPLGQDRLVPIVADPLSGVWVIRIDRAPP